MALASSACIPNPALQPLAFLIGTWRTTGTHPNVPDTVLGETAFEWHLGRAFLLMRAQMADERFPAGLMLFGSDDQAGTIRALYFDQRGISRHMEVTVAGDGAVTWSRDNPEFAQTLTIRARSDRALECTGRRRERGGPWINDLSQVFTRR